MAESHAEKSLKPKSKSKKSKSKKHKIRTMHIQPAENGGFVATHDHEPDADDETGQTPPSSIHALGDVDQLQQHIQDHFGGGGAPAGGGEPQAQAAPAAGPGGM